MNGEREPGWRRVVPPDDGFGSVYRIELRQARLGDSDGSSRRDQEDVIQEG